MLVSENKRFGVGESRDGNTSELRHHSTLSEDIGFFLLPSTKPSLAFPFKD